MLVFVKYFLEVNSLAGQWERASQIITIGHLHKTYKRVMTRVYPKCWLIYLNGLGSDQKSAQGINLNGYNWV